MSPFPPVVQLFTDRVAALGWVEAVWVGGSAATGDHVPGISDLDLVALTAGPVDPARRRALVVLHRDLDHGAARDERLGCAYVDRARLADADASHPTWTHARLVDRPLSLLARAELARVGVAVSGPAPSGLLAPVTADDVRAAARAELTGYWSTATRRPWWLLDREIAELALTSAARGRHAMATGTLLTKTASLDHVRAPAPILERLRGRRRGEAVTLPRTRTAAAAWRDLRRTVALARAG